MSKAQRDKGAGGEREVCALLSDALGKPIRRKLGQARDSGHDIDVGRFRIEVKRRKRIAGLYEWLDQAEGRTTVLTEQPVVALRADGKEWLVCMRLSDWVRLAREEMIDESGSGP